MSGIRCQTAALLIAIFFHAVPACAAGNELVMIRTADSRNDPVAHPATWRVYQPDGRTLDTRGSKSQGLQEAISWAAERGHNLRVIGGPVKRNGQNPSIIDSTVPISVPPMQGGLISFEGVTLNFGPPMPHGLRFDSTMLFKFQMSGSQIVCGPAVAICLLFKPEGELPQDPAGPVITSSRFEIGPIVMLGGGSTIVMDSSLAPISSNRFDIMEPNGGDVGILITGGLKFDHNHIDAIDIHGQATCIRSGTSARASIAIYGNTWNAQCDPRDGGVGVEMWGHHDDWLLSVTNLEGRPANGVTLNASAHRNRVRFLRNDATTKVNNASQQSNHVEVH